VLPFRQCAFSLLGAAVAGVAMMALAFPPESRERRLLAPPTIALTPAIPTPVVPEAPPAADVPYELSAVAAGEARVPRLFANDLQRLTAAAPAEDAFIRTVLPLVLEANEEVRAERARLLALKPQLERGAHIAPLDRLWLDVLADRFGVPRHDLRELMLRVDVVPPSLALAQAAIDTDWGRSPMARARNTLFTDAVPAESASFQSLQGSAAAYLHTLNVAPRFSGLRQRRAEAHARGHPPDSAHLARALAAYPGTGRDYPQVVAALIARRELQAYDRAMLVAATPAGSADKAHTPTSAGRAAR
jgi:Bax protein